MGELVDGIFNRSIISPASSLVSVPQFDRSWLYRPGTDHQTQNQGRALGEAVIIEVRRLVRLPYVLLNFRRNLPSDWRITLVHGPQNGGDIWATPMHELRGHIRTGSIRLMPLPSDKMLHIVKMRPPPNRTSLWHHFSQDSKANASARSIAAAVARVQGDHHRGQIYWYNQWFKQTSFWTSFEASYLLVFEVDAILCPQPTVPISYWIGRYAYVGVPWHRATGAGYFWCKLMGCCVGNSGLSLWNRDVLERLLTTKVMPMHDALVDLWIATGIQKVYEEGHLGGLHAVPRDEIATAFSLADPPEWYGGPDITPAGLHGVKYWPVTRAGMAHWDAPGPWCVPRSHVENMSHSEAERRCKQLLQKCPDIEAISVNVSLSGELHD